ncbi:hypothetical protein TCSYLVIO_004395 [Trypanosoma cruzi]|nr:hypothetical protein TCSYLVIO_004395 [Trypanosoma cruzi]
MELSVRLFLESAPKRQRYLRATHILFGLSESGKFSPETRRQLLSAAVEYLKNGLSVYDIQLFRRSCEEHSDWLPEDLMVYEEEEAAVGARAEVALQSALSCLERLHVEDRVGKSNSNRLLATKRGRLESTELRGVRDQMRVAEVYADIRNYEAMSKAVNRLLTLAHSMQQTTAISNRADSVFVQLEVNRRVVELWLGAGNLDALRSLVGTSTATLMTQAAECLMQIQFCSPSRLVPQQRTVEDLISELEEYALFFSIVRGLCMFEDKNFSGFARVFTGSGLRGAGWIPAVVELNTKRNSLQFPASLGGDVNASGRSSVIHHLRNIVEVSITSGPQLGIMVLFSAIAALPRAEAMVLITRVDIMSLWEDVSDAHVLVQAFQLAKWGEFFCAASVLNSLFLKTDIFAHKHSDLLYRLVIQSVVLGYANAFMRLELRKAAAKLSIPLGELQEILQELVLEGRLQARMDFVSQVLTNTKFNRVTDGHSPQSLVLLDCICRSDMAMADLEQSLRILSLHRHHA